MTAPRACFSEVVRLPAEEVARLLRHGDPQERVWAAWMLGLRLGADAAPLVVQSLSRDPSAGARRHFLVVLAGAGALEAVRALAVADPDEEVRATGLQYLARLTSPADADLQAVLASRFAEEPSTDARIVLLQNLRNDAAPEVRRAAESLAGATPLALRTAVVERLLEWRRPAEGYPLALVARAPLETDAPLRRRLLATWWDIEGAAQVVEAAHAFPIDVTADVLDLARERAERPSWSLLELIVRRGDRRLDQRVVALLDEGVTAPGREWLLALKVAAFTSEAEWDEQRRLLAEAAYAATPVLRLAYARADRPTPTSRECDLAKRLLHEVAAEQARWAEKVRGALKAREQREARREAVEAEGHVYDDEDFDLDESTPPGEHEEQIAKAILGT